MEEKMPINDIGTETRYLGKKPYIFISYSHKDAKKVKDVISYLQRQNFRVWYDERMKPSREWDEEISKRVKDCTYFIAFVSKNYFASENCRDEMKYARDLNKKILLVYLRKCELPSEIAMRFSRSQAIFKYECDSFGEFAEKLLDSDGIDLCRDGKACEISEDDESKFLDGWGKVGKLRDFFCAKSQKVGIAGSVFITIYLFVWGYLYLFFKRPLWRIAEGFEDLGYASDSVLGVIINVFWWVHAIMLILGAVLIFEYFLRPKKKKYICTALLAAVVILITVLNCNNARFEASSYKCTPTLEIYFCDEDAHYGVLRNETSMFELKRKEYNRSEIPERVYGEHLYMGDEFVVLTENSTDEWKRFTENMNLPEGTHALYIPTRHMRYVSLAGMYGG